MNDVSIVVPTYNRGEALGKVLDRLLASDHHELGEVEIIVVDDGSPVPAAPVVSAHKAPPGFTLKCVRQGNAGPAAARNKGFAASHGAIVIFIDDDILVPPDLIQQHVEAHALNPGAVIFGMCMPPSDSPVRIRKVLEIIYGARPNNSRFERASLVSSQHLSVEKGQFRNGVYASHLRTPAAEECELSARLLELGIPLFNATEIGAVHDQLLKISDLCEQQYKHAMGCAEAVCKLPTTLILDELAKVAAANGPTVPHDPLTTKCKKLAKSLVAISPVRKTLVSLCRLAGCIAPNDRMNAKLLLFAIGVFFFAGYREGLRRFGLNR